MALLPILHYPDPRLKRIAKPVTTVDDDIRQLVADMAQTMYGAPGVGLAATQVDVHKQIIVIDISDARDDLHVFINPRVVTASNTCILSEEGCLSVPGVYENVERPDRVVVAALDAQGQPFELDARGLLAVCIQHEMDHLRGIMFVDYLSQLKQSRIRGKMRKLERQTA